jgi:tRNA modification GTPase
MKAPNTYTKEDVVEIQCHGGYLVLKKILDLVLKNGARLAQPGEFTKRAFLNGRIDLTQAEAVIDIIRAKTTAGLEIANQQLLGMFKNNMVSIKETLLDHLTLMEAQIDFPDEAMEPFSKGVMEQEMKGIITKMEEWIDSYKEGRIFREGISCAIIGKTNVGKSSLLNALLMENRSIVTPFPGTTRDVIEEVLNIQGIPVRLVDTAGLRKTADSIEQEGVRRAEKIMKDADLILLVLDGSREVDDEDLEILQSMGQKDKVVVLNKVDLPLKTFPETLEPFIGNSPTVYVSAMNREGISDLKGAIYGILVHSEGKRSPDHVIVANIRHKEALSLAKGYLSNAVKSLEEGNSYEFIAFELRATLESLGELVGETAPEEVLNRIFEKFCIGK